MHEHLKLTPRQSRICSPMVWIYNAPQQRQKVMLRSINQLHRGKLRASDGEIGYVKDFYFDDQKWVVRYAVLDTGSWLSGRQVLIAPHAFGNLDQNTARLIVNLTRQQIENSPPIESHKPVSGQFEEEHYRPYGLPSYRTGEEPWGPNIFPAALPPPCPMPIRVSMPTEVPMPTEAAGKSGDVVNVNDPHLRSTRAVTGYKLRTREEAIGHVTDFVMDDKSWAICNLVVETGSWFSGKEIVISPVHVDRINHEDSKVYVNLTKEAILQAPEFHILR
jgi:uncharacterized protein YrrD